MIGCTEMRRNTILFSALCFLAVIASADVSQRAALIRPTAEEMRWKQIPWITSLAEAQKVAARERRPLFIWTDDDDPLDRC